MKTRYEIIKIEPTESGLYRVSYKEYLTKNMAQTSEIIVGADDEVDAYKRVKQHLNKRTN